MTPKQLDKKLDISYEKLEKGTSLFQDSLRKFLKNKMAALSCLLIIFLFLISFFSSYVTPYSFDEGDLTVQNFPPVWYRSFMREDYKKELLFWAQKQDKAAAYDVFSGTQPQAIRSFEKTVTHLSPEGLIKYLSEKKTTDHLLGTDEIGQDIYSRVIYGMRLSLLLALTVTLVSVLIGTLYGATAGFLGGGLDQLMMRFVDFLFGIPFIFLIILLMVFFGRHVFLIFVGLGFVYWIVLARIVRGQVLSLKKKEFILAAISNGVSKKQIILRHLIPNTLGPVIVFSTLLVPQIMLLEAFLSFIGLGVSPPDVSLGIMISDGAAVLSSYSWPIIFPGLIFSIMIFCMNFIGDGLRDALDPKSLK